MINVVDVGIMKSSDSLAIKSGVPSKELIMRVADKIFTSYKYDNNVAIVCGPGNNGSDGYALAKLLKENGCKCNIYTICEEFTKEGKFFYDICLRYGIECNLITDDTQFDKYQTIVDCIFEIGFHGKVDDKIKKVISKINNSGAYVISIDINSGLNGDNGLCDVCVKSDLTLSVGAYKLGHFLNKAKDYIGELKNLDVGINTPSKYNLLEISDFKNYLIDRENYSHKGSYGYVAIMGGCKEYSGAVKLAAMACGALRSGSGVVRMIIPSQIFCSFAKFVEEPTIFCMPSMHKGHFKFNKKQIHEALKGIKALAIGMGWGKGKYNVKILEYILKNFNIPVVVDADAINALAEYPEILLDRKSNIIITPHIKEFSRLVNKSCEEILYNPIMYAEKFSSQYKVITVLKGPTTIITDGTKTYLCDRGCAGMATAGSGDVLSGIIVGVLGQKYENTLLSVAYATFLNGIAGEIAQRNFSDIGMTSKDTVTKIPEAIIYCRKNISDWKTNSKYI